MPSQIETLLSSRRGCAATWHFNSPNPSSCHCIWVKGVTLRQTRGENVRCRQVSAARLARQDVLMQHLSARVFITCVCALAPELHYIRGERYTAFLEHFGPFASAGTRGLSLRWLGSEPGVRCQWPIFCPVVHIQTLGCMFRPFILSDE